MRTWNINTMTNVNNNKLVPLQNNSSQLIPPIQTKPQITLELLLQTPNASKLTYAQTLNKNILFLKFVYLFFVCLSKDGTT